MIPAGLIQFEASLWLWIFAAIRPGAAFLVAPLFGAPSVPMQLRLVVAMALGTVSYTHLRAHETG
jgi:flagellar biosynthetic protein FliR